MPGLTSGFIYHKNLLQENEMNKPETVTLAVMDIRRSPTQAPLIHRVNTRGGDKTLTFKLYTGDLWEQNPDAHMYIVTDGYVATGEPSKSLRGRGITIGHTHHCDMGVGFEMFGENNGYPDICLPIRFAPNQFYDFVVETSAESIMVSVNDKESISYEFAKYMPSFDTVIGVAGDSQSSTYGFFDVKQTITESPPVEPPVEPPSGTYDYDLDMTVSNHIDMNISAGETKIYRFIFTKETSQSFTHFGAVLMATGPCIKLAMPEYGYEQEACREEVSESVATDDKHTSWVIPRNKYVYLHVINSRDSGRLRLSWLKETTY